MTDDQELLRETAARFVESTLPVNEVRKRLGQPADRRYLRQSAELGWYACFVPEEHGGGSVSGQPVLDAVVLAEVQGRTLQPAPSLVSNLAAHVIAERAGDDLRREVLRGVVSGDAPACYVFAEPSRGWDRGPGIAGAPSDRGHVLSGAVPVVPGLPGAEWLVVAAPVGAVDHHHVVPVDSPGVRVTPLSCLDGTRPCAELQLDEVVVPDDHVLPAADASGHQSVDVVLQLALVQLVSESVGTMRRLFEMTLDYAKARVAFGRPIGSFQAVKHLLADLSMVIELSSSIADEAAQALQARRPDAAELASVAKAYVGEAGIEVSQGCLQVHGGIGYTWEHDLHLYLRRLAADATLFGDAAWHRERLWHLDGLVEVASA